MKIQNEKLGECRVKLSVSTDEADIKKDYNDVLNAYQKNARLPGFRLGHIPPNVLRQKFGERIDRDVAERVVARYMAEAIKDQKLKVVARVSIGNLENKAPTSLSFDVVFDTYPEFETPDFRNLGVKAEIATLPEGAVDSQIELYRTQMSPRNESDDPIAEKDIVVLDYAAITGDAPLDQIYPGTERYAKATDFSMYAMKDAEFIPGLFEQIIGKKKGDEFAFDTTFPADFIAESLRGVVAKYKGVIKAVRKVALVSDEELLAQTKMEDMEKLRSLIAENILGELQNRADAETLEKIKSELTSKATFAVPESMVAARLDTFLEGTIREEVALAKAEDSKAYAKEHAEEIREKAKAKTEAYLRLVYICEAISKEADIKVSEEDVQREITAYSQYYAQSKDKSLTPKVLRQRLEESGNIVILRQDLLVDKIQKYLVAETKKA